MKLFKAFKAFFLILLSDEFFVATVETNNLETFGDMDLPRFREISTHVINFSELPDPLAQEINDLLKS